MVPWSAAVPPWKASGAPPAAPWRKAEQRPGTAPGRRFSLRKRPKPPCGPRMRILLAGGAADRHGGAVLGSGRATCGATVESFGRATCGAMVEIGSAARNGSRARFLSSKTAETAVWAQNADFISRGCSRAPWRRRFRVVARHVRCRGGKLRARHRRRHGGKRGSGQERLQGDVSLFENGGNRRPGPECGFYWPVVQPSAMVAPF